VSKPVLTVLVIDDDPQIAPVVATHLRRDGYNALAAKDGKSGLEMARTHLPDVVLCDADMADLSGAQVIQILKADPATAHIAIVLMTGIADADMFLHVQWNSFLAKPFARKELSDAISNALATKVAG